MFSRRQLLAIAPLFVVGGWATRGFSADATPDGSPDFEGWVDDDYQYRIGAGDELSLRFLVNPDLNTAVTIGPDGRGAFPLVGAVKLTGATLDQANAVLSQAYGAVLRSPQVEVLVSSYGSAQIYVGGEVREPGVKPIKGQLTVAQAIMTAGGFSETARTGQVAVLRQRPQDSRPRLRVVNVKQALRGGGGDEAVWVRPGDVVFVPRSGIGEVDLFVKQYLTDLIPFGISYGVSTNGHL